MDTSGVWAFYYIQGEDGEDRSHPNAFKIPAASGSNTSDVTLADVLRHFPLQHQKTAFHFRFRINSSSSNASKSNGSSNNTFFWLDVTAPTQKVPLVNGRVICKLLRLERPTKVGLVFKRKPVLKWASDNSASKAPVQPLARQHSVSSDAPFHRASSSPAFEKENRPTKYSDAGISSSGASASATRDRDALSAKPASSSASSSRSNSNANAPIAMEQPTASPPESFEDFLSGSSSASSSQAPTKAPVNLMSDSSWSDAPPTTKQPSGTSDFLHAMDPLAQQRRPPHKPASIAATTLNTHPVSTDPPKFDDDNNQTVGPVTIAEMQAHNKSTSDGSNVYNAKLVDKTSKTADVRRAMEERERQVQADVDRARDELRQRDDAVRAMSTMKESAALVLGPKLKSWAEDNGRTKNIRTLLSTMHGVMWDGSKWSEVNMGKLINPTDVKRHYQKAMLVVHPDKNAGRNAEQMLIAERVFAAVNTAWNEFLKANP